jgi:hypothetical protein
MTELQIRPASPVCFVTKYWPIIFPANSAASSGLKKIKLIKEAYPSKILQAI